MTKMEQPPMDLFGEQSATSDEKRDKKELLRTKVQALVSSYEEEKRRNEALSQELERLRSAQTQAAPAPQTPPAAQYAQEHPMPVDTAPQYAPQAPLYAPQTPQQTFAQPQAPRQQALRPQPYSLQNFAHQQAQQPMYPPQIAADTYQPAAQPQNLYASAQTQNPYAPTFHAYAPAQQQNPYAQQQNPYAPARQHQEYPQSNAYMPNQASETPKNAYAMPQNPYVPPMPEQDSFRAQSIAYETTEALFFSMNRVMRRIEQVRARLHQADGMRGTMGYQNPYAPYAPIPSYQDEETATLLDRLFDELGDLNRDLMRVRASFR
jgi:hypothetical protein